MKKFYVLIGNFGSGKTEISLNIAINAAKTGSVVLADLDIVNPYFRSSERKQELQQAGVKLLHSNFAMTTVDVPSLPPDIYSVFVDQSDTVVFDVGGDPTGATALGQYKNNFSAIPEEALQVFYVVNVRRPLSSTPEQVLDMIHRIGFRSRLGVTGLINNSNLSYETTVEDILAGYEVLKEVSIKSGIPIVHTSGMQAPLAQFMDRARQLDEKYIGKPMPLIMYTHRDWDNFTQYGI